MRASRAFLFGFAAIAVVSIGACSSLGLTAPPNSFCTETGQVPSYSIYCSSWGNGYCQSTSTRTGPLVSVCVAYACKPGFVAPNGKAKDGCFAGEELGRRRRTFSEEDALTAKSVPGQGERNSWRPVFAPDSMRVAFVTTANNLAGTTYRNSNIVVKDLRSGGLTRVTIGLGGEPPNGDSDYPQFTPDGTGVVFQSSASNLVEGDTNGTADIFIADLRSGAIKRLSVLPNGRQSAASARFPKLSPDGRRLAFVSSSNEWTPHLADAGECDYVKDLRDGSVVRLPSPSRSQECSSVPSFIPGGDSLALVGYSEEGVGILHILNIRTGAVTPLKFNSRWVGKDTSSIINPVVSRDGGKLAFAVQTTLATSKTIAFSLVIIDLKSGATETLLAYGSLAEIPALSPDGRRLAFTSGQADFVQGDKNQVTDVFLKDMRTSGVTRISTASDGSEANGASAFPVFSPDGNRIAFLSSATNLVAGDTNGVQDVFVKELRTGVVTRASATAMH